MAEPWQIWIDTGGTFTDAIGVSPGGDSRRVKILSTGALRGSLVRAHSPSRLEVRASWEGEPAPIAGLCLRWLGSESLVGRARAWDPPSGILSLDRALDGDPAAGATFELTSDEEAPVLAARLLTGVPAPRPLPHCRMRLATTLGTNLLLERAGEPTALFTTRGLGDVLAIGTQQRPDLFARHVRKTPPLHAAVVEVCGRLDASGREIVALDLDAVERPAQELLAAGVRVAAVALAHAWCDPRHEHALCERLLALGFAHVSCSSDLSPRIKLLPRAATALVDAYLAPVLGRYLDRVRRPLAEGSLLVLTSAGGLVSPRQLKPKDCLLSGPAGGVLGAARAGARAGYPKVIGFDMGGTSTDVARWDGAFQHLDEHRVGDAVVFAPALAIETVAAGGGSVCWLDEGRLRVGPRSAGARPGPACYGAGGPLCLTDVNLLLGRLDPERFEIPIHAEPAAARLAELVREVEAATGERAAGEAVLEGLLAVADEVMGDAIRRVSLRRGHDPAEHALVAFGGAGGQHATSLAARLGIDHVLVPAHASLLSAEGLGLAAVERIAERQVLEELDRARARLGAMFEALDGAAIAAVAAEGIEHACIAIHRRVVRLRFAGQDATIELDWEPGADLAASFERRHEELFGQRPDARAIEVESLRVLAAASGTAPETAPARVVPHEAAAAGRRRARFGGRWLEVPCLERERLASGARFAGPALVLERTSATVVEEGWSGEVDTQGGLRLTRQSTAPALAGRDDDSRRPEAVRLELFTQRFTTLVAESGERLERTAISTNVRERLDFSCALLDPRGRLVANAPHIPVHLGAIGLCVRRLAASLPLAPGDVIVTNHPAWGGSHLPDVTVVTPVHAGARLVGYVANRAHHAEIGGVRPGSMPPGATRLGEEGVVIAPRWLARGGRWDWDGIRRVLLEAPHPTRCIEDNLADLRAAAAANHAGARALEGLVAAHGADTIGAYMERLEALAATRLDRALARLGPGVRQARQTLDDGTPLAVRIAIGGSPCRVRFDFTGSGAVHPGNLNATPAIVHSAVIYVLRLLLDEPLPLNEGLLDRVAIDIPTGLLNPTFVDDPMECPAVVGGNVETSQRLVDTLLEALGLAACSQGTMNNVIFGNERYGYYETLGGGCGAGPGFAGASAVHSHMTNTRITDVEVLERRYPVRVERFAVRRGSGGRGRWDGGDGIVRELCFLEPAELSVLTQHRTVAPYGVDGGAPGACGAQRVVRAGGEVIELGSIAGCTVGRGDRLVIETPGGGGWGIPDAEKGP